MNSCTNLYLLSTIACQLSQCLTENELSLLSSDLVVLSDMLASISIRQTICQEEQPAFLSQEESDNKIPFPIIPQKSGS